MGAMAREAARWVIGPRSFRRLMPAFGWLGPLAMGRPTHAFVAQVRAILATDESMAELLATVTVPALVMVGNQDILTPRGDSEELAERLPNAELVVISGAAHGFMVEHATTFNRVLLEFLGRVTARAGDGRAGSIRSPRRVVRVAVVGAGLAGLMAARTLAARRPRGDRVRQGPLARRTAGDAPDRRRTARSRRAVLHRPQRRVRRASCERWQRDGLVREWCRGFATERRRVPALRRCAAA